MPIRDEQRPQITSPSFLISWGSIDRGNMVSTGELIVTFGGLNTATDILLGGCIRSGAPTL